MKYFLNNSTTYNYSQYATRPKWLTFFLVKNTFPYLLKKQKDQQALIQSSLDLKKKNPKKIKLQKECILKSEPLVKKKHNIPKKKNKWYKPFKRNSFLRNTKFPDLNFLKKNQKTDNIYKIKTKYLFLEEKKKQKTHKQTYSTSKKFDNSYSTQKNLFQTKELLCWTADLSFFNLRGYFFNILKALQICRFAARNNKKILFIKGNHFNEGNCTQFNSWFAQYRRQIIPFKLCGILKVADKKGLLHKKVNHFNFKMKAPKKTKNKVLVSYQHFYLVSGLLNSSIKVKSVSAHNNNKKPIINSLISNNFKECHKTPRSLSTLNNFSRKKLSINNIIKIWIKEGQVMSQLPALGLAIPLKGFLTNSKTAFYTIYNTVYSDIYNRTNFSKITNVTTYCSLENLPKVQINKLEKINYLNKGKKKSKSQTKSKKNFLLFSGSNKQYFFLFRKLKKKSHPLKVPLVDVVKNTLYFLQKKKHQIKKKLLFNDNKRGFSPMHQTSVIRPTELVTLYWRKYLNKGATYLPLTINSNTIYNKDISLINSPFTQVFKIKKQQLEYPFFGNILTWQFSNFHLAPYVSNQQKKEKKLLISNFIKQQKVLSDRLAIQFHKYSTFFGFFKIKQLQSINGKLFAKQKSYFTKKLNIKIAFFKEILKAVKLGLMTNRFIVPKDTFKLFFSLSKRLNSTFLNKRQNTQFTLKNTTDKKRLNKFSKISLKSYYKYNSRFTYGYSLKQEKSNNILYTKTLIKFKNKKNRILVRKLCPTLTSVNKYYTTIKAFNQLKQYEMFVKTPFVNNRIADIIFFINPEKNQNLVNQANNLKIPTIGIVSGITVCKAQVKSKLFRGKHKQELFKDSVYFPILGNPASDFFTRTILNLFVKALYNKSTKVANKIK